MRRLISTFLAVSLLLCAPSYVAWFRRPFDIGAIEFDPWFALLPVRWPGQVAHTLLFFALGFVYVMITRRKEPLPRWFIPTVWAIYFVAVPWISPDVFFYLSKGWMEAHYGLNPYVVTVVDVPGSASDAMFMSMAPSLTSQLGNYGPVFQKLSALVASLSFGSPVVGLVLFKTIFTAALWGCYTLVRRIAGATARVVDGMDKWFLLNPILLFNFLTAAHNDVLLMLLILSGVLALFRGHTLWAGLFLGLSISFKLAGVFLLPVLALYLLLARGWRQATGPLVAALAGVVMGASAGILVDASSWSFFTTIVGHESNRFRSSIHILVSPLTTAMGNPLGLDSMAIGKIVFTIAGACLLWLNARRYREQPSVFVVVSSFEVLILAQFLVMPSMAEWYVLWPMCFALCCPGLPARQWCTRLSVLYMPLVVWHLQGPLQVVAFAQLTILGFLAVAHGGYFVRKFRTEVNA